MSDLPPETGTGTDQHAIRQTRAHLRQLTLQCAAAFTVLSLTWPYFFMLNETLPWPATALAIGAVALLLASLTGQPWWWRIIHVLFAPLAWALVELSIDPGWFLLAFILLLLVYRGALTNQIPLYLSSADTAAALARIMSERPGKRFVDLGAGIGSVIRPLARALPEAQLTGIENAPATWLVGYLSTASLPNCSWQWGDLWRTSLAEYDVVYAFLSLAPMPALWEKVKHELPSGSIFISNSFPVPGVLASNVVEIDDASRTRLYCYRR